MRFSVGLACTLLVGCSFNRSGLPPSVDTTAGNPADSTMDLPPPPVGDGLTTCPPGKVPCGAICVDIQSDLGHCGACDQPCGKDADSCQAGKCICGTTGAACSGGLNCIAGSCRCTAGADSLCIGCCNAGICRALGLAQDAQHCGTGGNPCQSCSDGKPCTADTCQPNGVCAFPPSANGAACDDGKHCVVNETCQNGVCQGQPKQCFQQVCKVATCSEQQQGCVYQNLPNGTKCGKDKVCKWGYCVWS